MATRRHLRRITAVQWYKFVSFSQCVLALVYVCLLRSSPPSETSDFQPASLEPEALPGTPRPASKQNYTFVSLPTLDRPVTPRTDPVYTPRPVVSTPTLCAGRARYGNHVGRKGAIAPTVKASELENAFELLVARYLAPWIPLTKWTPVLQRPITMKLLNSMEVVLRGGAFRVRLAGDGTVRYRVLEHWGQTYRVNRMIWTLDVLRRAMVGFPELAKVKCEFYVNVADSPRSTIDSMSKDMGGIPVFSFRTSASYLDVPVPDPVEYGSNGNYVRKAGKRIPFPERIPKLVFRGSSSSLQDYHDDNWLSVPRIRLASLSKEFPDLIDAGITKWMKLSKGATFPEVETSLGSRVVDRMDYEEQGKFQFVIDVDGGLGSSRKRGILTSGSVPFFQKSHWYMWYEPLLKPFYHFLPVDTYLQDLVETVQAAKDDQRESERITDRASCFGENVLSEEAAALYWKILLQRYSQLQYDPASGDEEVEPPMCSLRPASAEGPMGCFDGWYTYNGSVPFGCRYKDAKDFPYLFECWRDVGKGTEFKFADDPVHSTYHGTETES